MGSGRLGYTEGNTRSSMWFPARDTGSFISSKEKEAGGARTTEETRMQETGDVQQRPRPEANFSWKHKLVAVGSLSW